MHACIPGARVAAAAGGFGAAILEGNPGLEQLLVTPSPIQDLRGAVRALRGRRWFHGQPFLTIQTVGNERTRVALAAMLSGLHMRLGHTVHPELSEVPLALDPSCSQIDNNLAIMNALGYGDALAQALRQDPALREPRVFPSEQHASAAQALLSSQGVEPDEPIALLITQTSVGQRKSWRPERFASMAETLHREHGMQIVFVGAKAEAPAIERLRAPLGFHTANVAGRTNLLELSALMQRSDIAISLDTGPMHLARAVKLPTVIIAPAWSPPLEWLPIGSPRARILKNADMPSETADYVIDEVSVADVESSACDLLAAYPPLRDRTRRQLES